MRYVIVKNNVIQGAIELDDPLMVNDGSPCPQNILRAVPQPPLITPQADIEVDGVMVPQEPLITAVPDIMVDPRWPLPAGSQVIQSDAGGTGDAWPLVAPAVDPNAVIDAQIAVLEMDITDRRWRDYTFGTENPPNWMAAQNTAISTLRSQRVKS